MRPRRQAAALFLSFLLPSLVPAITLDCSHIRDKGASFDLSKLSGTHYIFHFAYPKVGDEKVTRNTSFAIDLCKPLDQEDKYNTCKNGVRVCAQVRTYREDTEGEPKPDDNWSIAGEGSFYGGSDMDPKVERLKGASSEDAKREGVRIELKGGVQPLDDEKKKRQKLIATMVCDHGTTGLEKDKDKDKDKDKEEEEEDKKRDEGDDKPDDKSPIWSSPNKWMKGISYGDDIIRIGGEDVEVGVLRIEWRTKYACEDQMGKEDPEDDNKDGGTHWGIFTWFIIILFLGIAAYLIFGSWLNYSRHGARGWDLLPHGDTVRDLPYLLKDWGRRVVSTVQGGGSRGGYSAI